MSSKLENKIELIEWAIKNISKVRKSSSIVSSMSGARFFETIARAYSPHQSRYSQVTYVYQDTEEYRKIVLIFDKGYSDDVEIDVECPGYCQAPIGVVTITVRSETAVGIKSKAKEALKEYLEELKEELANRNA
ncbi:hypothetical protein [Metallosphaera sp.]|uniref:hypothetical protein n=1 Tax=Metallosphaera sp. TaxID=2020860 RepID=UPI003162DC1B